MYIVEMTPGKNVGLGRFREPATIVSASFCKPSSGRIQFAITVKLSDGGEIIDVDYYDIYPK